MVALFPNYVNGCFLAGLRTEADREDDLRHLLRASSEKPTGGTGSNPPIPSRRGQTGRILEASNILTAPAVPKYHP
ncbi:hypothetical protein BDR22DRAFT_894479 [Usnea florida]